MTKTPSVKEPRREPEPAPEKPEVEDLEAAREAARRQEAEKRRAGRDKLRTSLNGPSAGVFIP